MTNLRVFDFELEPQDRLEQMLLHPDDPGDSSVLEPALPPVEDALAPDLPAMPALDPLLDPAFDWRGTVISETEMIAVWGSLDFLQAVGCQQASVTSHGDELL